MTKHVAVLMGGWSSEREVSLRSGEACARALEGEGFRVTRVDVTRDIGRITSSTSGKSASSHPTMKASVPASAAAVPPETGASANRKPAALASAATARALSTSIVDESISSAV